MTNTTYTFKSGNTVPMTLRKDGRYTSRQVDAIQNDIAARLADVREDLSDLATAYPEGTDSAAVIDRWDGLHDAERALEEEYRLVGLNLPILLVGSTAWLAANNID